MTRRSPRFLDGVAGGRWSHSVGQEIEKGEQAEDGCNEFSFFKNSFWSIRYIYLSTIYIQRSTGKHRARWIFTAKHTQVTSTQINNRTLPVPQTPSLGFLPLSTPSVTRTLMSSAIDYFGLFLHIKWIIRYVHFSIWLFTQHCAMQPYCRVIDHPSSLKYSVLLRESTTGIHSTLDGHMSVSSLGVITNAAAVNNLVYVFVCWRTYICISGGQILGSGLPRSYGTYTFSLSINSVFPRG